MGGMERSISRGIHQLTGSSSSMIDRASIMRTRVVPTRARRTLDRHMVGPID
jgi:hypothetical protein